MFRIFLAVSVLFLSVVAHADPHLEVKTPFRIFGCVLHPQYKENVDASPKKKKTYLKRCAAVYGPSYDCERSYNEALKLGQAELADVTQFMAQKQWAKTNYVVGAQSNAEIVSPVPWHIYGLNSSFHASLMSGYGRQTPKGTMPYFIGYDLYDETTGHMVMSSHIYFVSTKKIYPVIDVTQITFKDTWLGQVFLQCKLDYSVAPLAN